MLTASTEFKSYIDNEKRPYLIYADATLQDGSVVQIRNANLWANGFKIEDQVSQDGSFSVGSFIVNKCTIVINNIYGNFSVFDFANAVIRPQIGFELKSGRVERINKGVFTLMDLPQNRQDILTLTFYDNAIKFDRAYKESTLEYPATLMQIVQDACSVCGVELGTSTFPHSDYVVNTKPTDENLTFRQVISYAAMIACCYCRCNSQGKLELKWYEAFAPGKRHLIEKTYSTEISMANTTITGVKTSETITRTIEKSEEQEPNIYYDDNGNQIITPVDPIITTEEEQEEKEYLVGEEGYVIDFGKNPLVNVGDAETVCGWLGAKLVGFSFRRATVSHVSNPLIEAGDVALLTDRKDDKFDIVISRTTFSTGSAQQSVSSAQSSIQGSSLKTDPITTQNSVDTTKLQNQIQNVQNTTNQKIEQVNNVVKDLSLNSLTIEKLKADEGYIAFLKSNLIEADAANIAQLVFDNATGVSIQTSFANAVAAQFGDATIKSAMIDEITANKIKSGTIYTSQVQILGDDNGYLAIRDNTIQISDDEIVRVQIGKDKTGDYNMFVFDADGNLMFDALGVTYNGITRPIIRDDVVRDDANISAGKLNIETLFSVINNDGSHTFNASKIYLDAEKQNLAVAFNSMKTKMTTLEGDTNTLKSSVASYGTDIEAIQGHINSKIWETYTNNAVNVVNGKLDTFTGEYSAKYSNLEQSLNGFKTTVESNYAKTESVNQSIASLQSQIDGAIETFTGSVEPTLKNSPAKDWTTNDIKDTHIGDLYIVNSSGGDKAGFYYRFEKSNNVYKWTLLKDTEITKALADAKAANDAALKAAQDVVDLDGRIQSTYSTTEQVKTMIGQSAEDISLEVSKDFVSITEYNNLQIGAANLVRNSNFIFGTEYWNIDSATISVVDDTKYIKALKVTPTLEKTYNRVYPNITSNFQFESYKKYSVSCMAKANANNVKMYISRGTTSTNNQMKEINLTTTWQRVYFSFETNGTGQCSFSVKTNNIFYITNVMVEESDKPSSWRPDYRDDIDRIEVLEQFKTDASLKITDSAIISTVTQSQTYKDNLTNKVDADKIASTINQTAQSVLIASSKIDLIGAVTISAFTEDALNTIYKYSDDSTDSKLKAYSDEATKNFDTINGDISDINDSLENDYFTKEDLNTEINSNNQTLTEAYQSYVNTNLANKQDASSTLDNVVDKFVFDSTGLNIYATDTSKLQLQGNRIGFYVEDNDVPVAEINQNRIDITNGNFKESLKIGRFKFIPRTSGNMSLLYVGDEDLTSQASV